MKPSNANEKDTVSKLWHGLGVKTASHQFFHSQV